MYLLIAFHWIFIFFIFNRVKLTEIIKFRYDFFKFFLCMCVLVKETTPLEYGDREIRLLFFSLEPSGKTHNMFHRL